jgi:diaminohydroxyphosphoribosylaminopyrimidine deaminase/5-amino-6-(5-phosphoribosylamino)uracil reductase
MPDQKPDEVFLRQALDLARQGIGLSSPNPSVGAVVVDAVGSVAGTGSHTYAGVKHAEVLALEQAGERARGATLYINLEPCSHTGRTGPCSDAVIAAGIRRVVASMTDPNPQVAGAGFHRLRTAGIEVEVGGFETEAKILNEAFARYIRDGIPFVTVKAAMTLDGKIAPPAKERRPGTQAYITGEESRAHAQELRHENDAIMVGVGTVIADDPLLTDRSDKPRRRRLLRVVLDSRLRLPLESRLVQTAKDDLLVLCSFAEEKKKRELLKWGVQVEQIPLPTPEGHPDLQAVVRYLGSREITSVMIEGGAIVNGAALSSGIVDKVFLYYAPKILGSDSIPFVAGGGRSEITDALRLRSLQLHRFGEDFAMEGYLRNPYGN